MDSRFALRTGIYISVSLFILIISTYLCELSGVNNLTDSLLDINYFDLLIGQIANTLIVLSLTSVLSANFGQAYWIDIKETKLINPFWGCFIGITVYLLTALVFSVGVYAIGCKSGVAISSIFSLILLIILTFKMISIYFGKEELKKQLSIEYKRMIILSNSSHVCDYLQRLEKFIMEVEEGFFGKAAYIRGIKKEIRFIKEHINAKDQKLVDSIYKDHIDKHVQCLDDLRSIDSKIIEYTKNAINDNESEVVKENVALLVESENYSTFFSLIEELFDWDEKYTCKALRSLCQKNMAWVIKSKTRFFKQYALQKMIKQSGKLDAIQNLLLIYDSSNLGMSGVENEIKTIINDLKKLQESDYGEKKEKEEIDLELEEIKKKVVKSKQMSLLEEDLYDELIGILSPLQPKDLRSYYIPITETCVAYEEKQYEIVLRYVAVILENFIQDVQNIKLNSGIMEFRTKKSFCFSYVTDTEKKLIDHLILKDKDNQIISDRDKSILTGMNKVHIDNGMLSSLNGDSFEIFSSVFK